MINVIIIDDESKGRESLKKLLEKYCGDDVKILGLGDSVAAAKKLVEMHEPDLVFLDIRMPMGDGFSLLESYDEVPFDVIFTTAYDQYALKAFRFSAIDYLLKPIEIQELKDAVAKIKKKNNISEAEHQERFVALKENLTSKNFDKVTLPTSEGYSFVQRDDIIRLEANGNYTTFYLKDKSKYLITRTLKYYDEMLRDYGFYRVHKSHMVNLRYVTKFIKGRQGFVETINGDRIEVSTRKREELLKALTSML
jgi:two-component system LytT family response regulator